MKKKTSKPRRKATKPAVKKTGAGLKHPACKCPMCEELLVDMCSEVMVCRPCSVKFIKCQKCGELFSDTLGTCPHCREPR